MSKDTHIEASEELLKLMRKDGIIDFSEMHQDVLTEKLCEWVMKPWFWSEEDLTRKVNSLWDRHRDYFKKRRVPESKAKTELHSRAVKDAGPVIGVFYYQKRVDSIGTDLVDFLYDTQEIEEIYPTNGEIIEYFRKFLVDFVGSEPLH